MFRVIYQDGQTSEHFSSKQEAICHLTHGASIQVLDSGDWMLLTSWIP